MLATLKQTAELVDFFRVNGAKQTYKKNDYIIRPGEVPNGVFYIYEGLVKAYDITKYGEENLLVIRKQEEIFPLIWAVTGDDHNIIYQALEPTITNKIYCLDVSGDFLDVDHYYDRNDVPPHEKIVKTIEQIVLNWR